MNRDSDPKPDGGPRAPSNAGGVSTGPPCAAVPEGTQLAGLHSWRRVYLAVLGLFAVWVGLLTWLTLAYS